MKTERVLHLIDSAGMYGAEKVILTLLEELRNSKFPGILGCIRENETEVPQIASEMHKKGIPVHYFTMKRGLNPLGLQSICRYIQKNNICLVHSHGYKPDIFLGILPKRKFKTISTVHGWAKETSGAKGRVYEFLDSLALKRIDKVVAVSKAVRNDLMKRGLKKEKIDLIYNGIKINSSTNQFDISQIRQRFGMLNDDFIIGTVGRLGKIKGHLHLIYAMPDILKEIKNCKLIIAGTGPLRGNLEALIDRLNLSNHVKLTGYNSEINQLLAIIDLFILPSLSEGLPVSLLEAMALGKPIIASRVGGIPEVITNQNEGVLVPPADPNSISHAVKNMYKDKDRMKRLFAKGIKLVEDKFSSTDMAKKYSMIYSTLIT